MIPTTILAGVLVLLVAVSGATAYLMYLRVQYLKRESERLRSKMEVGDDELEQIESSLNSVSV